MYPRLNSIKFGELEPGSILIRPGKDNTVLFFIISVIYSKLQQKKGWMNVMYNATILDHHNMEVSHWSSRDNGFTHNVFIQNGDIFLVECDLSESHLVNHESKLGSTFSE